MNQKGFSLVELLMALSIIGIILAYAIPNYTAHLTHARRLTAETALMNLAGHMEAYFAEHNTYEGATFSTLKVPAFIAEHYYRLVIQSATGSRFKLAAIPQDFQARHDVRCGSLVLNSEGVKRVTGYGRLNECW